MIKEYTYRDISGCSYIVKTSTTSAIKITPYQSQIKSSVEIKDKRLVLDSVTEIKEIVADVPVECVIDSISEKMEEKDEANKRRGAESILPKKTRRRRSKS